jgi:hypothetical protein
VRGLPAALSGLPASGGLRAVLALSSGVGGAGVVWVGEGEGEVGPLAWSRGIS